MTSHEDAATRKRMYARPRRRLSATMRSSELKSASRRLTKALGGGVRSSYTASARVLSARDLGCRETMAREVETSDG